MTTCNAACPACSKTCDLDPQHEQGFGKLAATHEHSYEYIAHVQSNHRGFRVMVIHQWRVNV